MHSTVLIPYVLLMYAVPSYAVRYSQILPGYTIYYMLQHY